MSAINKRFHTSGLAEIFEAADIISECSLDQAVCGKHFNRSIRCLTLIHALTNLTAKCHNENTTTRLFLDERGVQDLYICITEFDYDSFDLSYPTLRSLQSRMIASDGLVADFNTSHSDGESVVQSFFKEWMSNDSTVI